MHKDKIIEELNKLEVTARVYSDNYGPDSKEVRAVNKLIELLNLKVLDLVGPDLG